MMRKLIRYGALAAALGIGACESALVVENENQGNTEKVVSTPNDAEALIGTYFKRWVDGMYGSLESFDGRGNNWTLANYSSLANNCQNTSVPFAGNFVVNTPGNNCREMHYRMYLILGEVNRVASNVLGQLDGGLNMGTGPRGKRLRAFSEFLRGMSIGYVALMHDSLAVVAATMKGDDAGTLVSYVEAMDSAYAAFARAEAIANDATASSVADAGFPLPTGWIPGEPASGYTAAEFVRLIRSNRARLRAHVARTKADGDAVDWDLVIADAQNGITADWQVLTGTTIGGTSSISWRAQYDQGVGGGTWHQMPPFYIGFADVSGSYAAWIAQPVGERGAGNVSFFMVTPDLRFPQGATRDLQIADFLLSSCEVATVKCRRYFRNRPPGNDNLSGFGWGWSNYDFARFHSWVVKGDNGNTRQGKTPIFTLAELDLLQAEGLIRKQQYGPAATLINKTRTAAMVGVGAAAVAVGGGLPAVTGTADGGAALTGPNCVPKIPAPPGFTSLQCGDLWEAMKWEKRIETVYTTYVPWLLDGRRWADLPEGTPLFLPVPYQDWQARNKAGPIYSTGSGPGTIPGSGTTAKGTYGW